LVVTLAWSRFGDLLRRLYQWRLWMLVYHD
jgi:hypothetical protein